MLKRLLLTVMLKILEFFSKVAFRLHRRGCSQVQPSVENNLVFLKFSIALQVFRIMFSEYRFKLPDFSERDVASLPNYLARLPDNPDSFRERLLCLRACCSVLIPTYRFWNKPSVDECVLNDAEMYFVRFMENPDLELNRFNALVAVGRLIFPEYRFIWPQLDWLNDEEFNRYLDKFGELRGMNTHRKWHLSELLKLVSTVPGDTVECGAYQGASSYIICKANSTSGLKKIHHIFDSFEGLSVPGENDGMHWEKGDLAASEQLVNENLKEFAGNFKTYAGWIPERFSEVSERKFCFVHLDVDLYEPTRDSLEFFYPRLSPGAVLLCDDYGSAICPGATKAVDDFLEDKPEVIVSLAASGGFFIKS